MCYSVSEMAGWHDLVAKILRLILDNFAELAGTNDFPRISPELLAKLISDNTLRVRVGSSCLGIRGFAKLKWRKNG